MPSSISIPISHTQHSLCRLRSESSSYGAALSRPAIAPFQYNLDDCVGLGHAATKSIILGFTQDGERLISYTRRGFTEVCPTPSRAL